VGLSFDNVKGHICNYFLTREHLHVKSLEGAGRQQAAHFLVFLPTSQSPKPSKLPEPSTTPRNSYSPQPPRCSKRCPCPRRGCLRRLDSAPSRSRRCLLFPPLSRLLIGFRVPPWWVLGAGSRSRLNIRSFSRPWSGLVLSGGLVEMAFLFTNTDVVWTARFDLLTWRLNKSVFPSFYSVNQYSLHPCISLIFRSISPRYFLIRWAANLRMLLLFSSWLLGCVLYCPTRFAFFVWLCDSECWCIYCLLAVGYGFLPSTTETPSWFAAEICGEQPLVGYSLLNCSPSYQHGHLNATNSQTHSLEEHIFVYFNSQTPNDLQFLDKMLILCGSTFSTFVILALRWWYL
jgi:hypothetical protein